MYASTKLKLHSGNIDFYFDAKISLDLNQFLIIPHFVFKNFEGRLPYNTLSNLNDTNF